ncbi:MAG: hypothetical protein IJ735_05910 [Clostridia bacterium]|nr:hypothetical protein [Clostridia bacterium]
MSFNPFEEKPISLDAAIMDWSKIYPKSYDKNDVDPYTKVRCILMNGTEYESVWYSHQFHRHCADNDVRRSLAIVRRNEQQQQKRVACLKPINETVLETTISYEQLAVDLTAIFAQSEPDPYVKKALDFALLEDFDHLYRYADLLDFEQGVHAERLVGNYTEITPGRPTIAEHRHGGDDVKRHVNFSTCDPITKLHVSIITAAEQQTMNYYMNQSAFYFSDLGRRLYQEIGMIEEQHVTQYGSLMDVNVPWAECWLNHEYTECYLYYSCYKDETDPYVKKIWEQCLTQEIAHLHEAARILKKVEKKDWQQVIPNGEFPTLLSFSPQKDYIRKVLRDTVTLTADGEDYRTVNSMPDDSKYFFVQERLNKEVDDVPSHEVIKEYIEDSGMDYRYEDFENPVQELRDRRHDNVSLARVKEKVNA